MHRTPPTTPTPTIQVEDNIMQSDSDSTTLSEAGRADRPNTMTRYKRRRDLMDDTISGSLSTHRNELIELINEKFNVLHADMIELKNHNIEICKNLEFMSQKYEEIKSRYDILDREAIASKEYIQELEEKIENYERNNRSTSIEIKNIPKKQGESKIDLPELTICLAKALDLDLQKSEIQDAYRVNVKSNANPPIVVKFTTAFRKEEFIKKSKKVMKENHTKLGNEIRSLGYPITQVYVAEHLTAKTRRLFMLARDFAKGNGFQFCWCSYGRIFLRKREGVPHVWIKEEKQMEGLRAPHQGSNSNV